MTGSGAAKSLLRRVDTSISDSTGDKDTDSGEKAEKKKPKKTFKQDEKTKKKKRKNKDDDDEEIEDVDEANPDKDNDEDDDQDPDVGGDLDVRRRGRPSKRPAGKEPKKGRRHEGGEKKKKHRKSRKHGADQDESESESVDPNDGTSRLLKDLNKSMEKAEAAERMAHPCIEVESPVSEAGRMSSEPSTSR